MTSSTDDRLTPSIGAIDFLRAIENVSAERGRPVTEIEVREFLDADPAYTAKYLGELMGHGLVYVLDADGQETVDPYSAGPLHTTQASRMVNDGGIG